MQEEQGLNAPLQLPLWLAFVLLRKNVAAALCALCTTVAGHGHAVPSMGHEYRVQAFGSW